MTVRDSLNTLLMAPEFQKLEHRLRNLSAFHILGIERRELSHSALLGWLLDPRANHGFGLEPLRRFLMTSASLSSRPSPMLDAIDIDTIDLDTVIVETEVNVPIPNTSTIRRLDLLVSLPCADAPRGTPVLVVEYKVDSSEGEDQTKDYAAWAEAQPTTIGDRDVLPLQVFLCPSRGEAAEPEPPFIRFDYDSYVHWLDGLEAMSGTAQSKFLLREFRTCLAQRADVSDIEQDELLDKLQTSFPKELIELRNASSLSLAPFSALIANHNEVFGMLGLLTKNRPKGASAFAAAMRRALKGVLQDSDWKIGGVGSLCATSVWSADIARELIENRSLGMTSVLRLQFFMDRPKRRARLALEVVGDLPGLSPAENRALRERVAGELRKRIPSTASGKLGRGQTIIALLIATPQIETLEDDNEANVASLRVEIENVANEASQVWEAARLWMSSDFASVLKSAAPTSG